MPKSYVILFAVVFWLFSCSDPVIDASSDESLKNSIQKIKGSLDDQEVQEFDDSLELIAFEDVTDIESIITRGADPEHYIIQVKDRIEGKTADEIISMGQEIKERRRMERKAELTSQLDQMSLEIDELKLRKDDSEKAKSELAKFVINKSRFYFYSSHFLDEPIIELEVENRLDAAISRAYFHGILATPGRSVPWVEEDFNYEIPGGLEPTESAIWKLNPNMFSTWGSAPKDRNDMVLTVSVVKLDGPDGDTLFNAVFESGDEDRLNELEKQYYDVKAEIAELNTDSHN